MCNYGTICAGVCTHVMYHCVQSNEIIRNNFHANLIGSYLHTIAHNIIYAMCNHAHDGMTYNLCNDVKKCDGMILDLVISAH